MQEILIKKLHEFISQNNPELMLSLASENKVNEYLQESVSAVAGLIDKLLNENKPGYVIEETCMDQMTEHLKPSRFNYVKTVLEEEFSKDAEWMAEVGILNRELINIIAVCQPVFNELGFIEGDENNRPLRYAIIGVMHEYLNGMK